MTKEEIGDLIEQLQSEHYAQGMDADDFIQELINRAIAIEREACAKVCDQRAEEDKFEGCYANACAEAIRARGES
jgi:hypothetical protein